MSNFMREVKMYTWLELTFETQEKKKKDLGNKDKKKSIKLKKYPQDVQSIDEL